MEPACDDVYKKCVINSSYTNIQFEVNGGRKPTKRRRWVVVFEREVMTPIEMAKGLRENGQCLCERIQDLFRNDIAELERLVF